VRDYPLPPTVAGALTALEPPAPQVDAGAALRTLRGEVDSLLAQGRVDQAEALMDQRRQELAQQGVYVRKINQAFFAFENIYATRPGSTDPIGPKVETLRERTDTLGAFLRAASRLTSEADLDRLLAAATSPGGRGPG
jgi:hypothetical protein